jgi:hypothetical protein
MGGGFGIRKKRQKTQSDSHEEFFKRVESGKQVIDGEH